VQYRIQGRFRRQCRASEHQLLESSQLGAGVVGGRGDVVRWTGRLGHPVKLRLGRGEVKASCAP
jgi:hypothetical protein